MSTDNKQLAELDALVRAREEKQLALAAPSAIGRQVGGGHYKNMKIQPVEFIHANGISFLEGCIIKRICRWRGKDGIQDLEKIKHEVDLLIELEKRNAPAATPTYSAPAFTKCAGGQSANYITSDENAKI